MYRAFNVRYTEGACTGRPVSIAPPVDPYVHRLQPVAHYADLRCNFDVLGGIAARGINVQKT